MSDDKTPDPLSDVAKGLGLLFRAARAAARKLPKKDLEEVVVTSAREVGRAIENVAATIERGVTGRNKGDRSAPPPDAHAPPPDAHGEKRSSDPERERSPDSDRERGNPLKRHPPG